VQNVNWIRAIEGELVRTIKSFNMVNNARVHVVLPKREILSRQQQKPSASIVIETLGGDLTSGQVAAIVNLVASAVPQLSADDISLMDNKGRVYSRGDGGSVAGGSMMSGLQERQTALEMRLRDEVVQMLERIVGPGKAHVDLAASLNFEKLTQETEVYDPDGQVVKSTQVFEDSENDTEQDAGDQVTVANNLPDAQGAAGGGRTQQSNRNSLQEITNFQNSRTSTMRVRESGELERLTVAVAVDGTYEVNDSGDAVYTARSAEELEQIRRLVQAAIGFDEGRGDQVTVEAMRFAPPEDLAFGDEPGTLLGFAGSDLIALVRVLVLGIVAILGILLVVRPLIIRLLASIPEPQAETTSEEGVAQLPAGVEPMALAPPEDGDDVTAELVALAAEGDEDARLRIEQAQSDGVQIAEKLGIGSEIDIARVEGQVRGSAMAKVGDIINRHPEESAAIVRQWLYSD
ncbi:MAG: flagellar basal-body MS-ring/collar protein FliF, partial [Pseudomonadota bacterium]